MKVYVIVTNENYLGEITTNCEGVFLSKDKASEQLKTNGETLMTDEDYFTDEEYNKYLDEESDNFNFTAMNKSNGEIEYTMYQGIIEKEITE